MKDRQDEIARRKQQWQEGVEKAALADGHQRLITKDTIIGEMRTKITEQEQGIKNQQASMDSMFDDVNERVHPGFKEALYDLCKMLKTLTDPPTCDAHPDNDTFDDGWETLHMIICSKLRSIFHKVAAEAPKTIELDNSILPPEAETNAIRTANPSAVLATKQISKGGVVTVPAKKEKKTESGTMADLAAMDHSQCPAKANCHNWVAGCMHEGICDLVTTDNLEAIVDATAEGNTPPNILGAKGITKPKAAASVGMARVTRSGDVTCTLPSETAVGVGEQVGIVKTTNDGKVTQIQTGKTKKAKTPKPAVSPEPEVTKKPPANKISQPQGTATSIYPGVHYQNAVGGRAYWQAQHSETGKPYWTENFEHEELAAAAYQDHIGNDDAAAKLRTLHETHQAVKTAEGRVAEARAKQAKDDATAAMQDVSFESGGCQYL